MFYDALLKCACKKIFDCHLNSPQCIKEKATCVHIISLLILVLQGSATVYDNFNKSSKDLHMRYVGGFQTIENPSNRICG